MGTALIATYYQLSKPGIVYSNTLAAIAGFVYGGVSGNWLGALGLALGTAAIIASGCAINNYFDRDIDSRMARTKKRALVTKALTSRQALSYAVSMGILGTLTLLLTTNLLTVALGLIGLISYAFVYTYAKHTTVHSTLIGTIPGAIPPVAGYAAATGYLSIQTALLFLLFVCWQLVHFYAIAIKRRDEYAAAGVPIASVVYGIAQTKRLMLLAGIGFLITTLLLFASGDTSALFLIVIGGYGSYWLLLNIHGQSNHDNDRKWAGMMFGHSLLILLLICGLLLLNPLLPF